MKIAHLLFGLCLLSISSFAQTNVRGLISTNTTFTKANSPYIIDSVLTVDSGVVLTIEPGVEVQFLDGKNLTIELKGQLHAVGTAQDSIKFTTTSSVKGKERYTGIYLYRNGTLRKQYQIKMKYCIIECARYFIGNPTYTNTSGIHDFEYCTFRDNKEVYLTPNTTSPIQKDSAFFKHCSFSHNASITNNNANNFNTYFTNCTFKLNTNGVKGGHIDSCIFTNNQVVAAASDDIKNSLFKDNHIALQIDSAKEISIINNEIIYNNIGIEANYWVNDTTKNFFKNTTLCHSNNYNIDYKYKQNAMLYSMCFCETDSLKIRALIRDGNSVSTVGNIYFHNSKPCSTAIPPTIITKNTTAQQKLTLYPNPSSQQTTLRFNYQQGHTYSVVIKNITGKTINSISNINTAKVAINNSLLPAGIYLLQLQENNRVLTITKMVVN
ncbi:MAG: T9SS type A sorting domain-containing protein [Flavipsychrobacter sp.]